MTSIDPPFHDAEQFLSQLNNLLSVPHKDSLQSALEERFATIHIIGAPRSGTTLTMQLVAATLAVAYPSNLAAMFWRAPCYGVALHRKLFSEAVRPTFKSRYGLTQGPQEPHEFGRFWRALFNYPDMEERPGHDIDWGLVRDTLVNITEVAGCPFAFKSFLPVWHLRELAKICEKSIFVHISRNPLENALSLLQARRSYAKSETDWVGLKPLACKPYETAPIAVQVVSQVIEVERSIAAQLCEIPQDRVIRTTLSEICARPETCISNLAERVNAVQNATVERRGDFPVLEESLPSQHAEAADIDAIRDALATFGCNT